MYEPHADGHPSNALIGVVIAEQLVFSGMAVL